MLNLLASAIPGLRDIRAPLVAGYLWLLIAWLAVEPSTPLAQHAAPGVASSVVELAETVGPVATAAGVSVLAYVVGAISVSLPGVIAPLLRRSLGVQIGGLTITFAEGAIDSDLLKTLSETSSPSRPFEERRPGVVRSLLRRWLARLTALLSRMIPGGFGEIKLTPVRRTEQRREAIAALNALERGDGDEVSPAEAEYIRRKLRDYASSVLNEVGPTRPPALEEVRDTLGEHWEELSPTDLAGVIARAEALGPQIRRELDLPNTLLVGDQPEIYAEADRARAEAEFRLALVLPSVALVAVLVVVGGWPWIFGILASWALLVTGLAKKEEARTFINNSIESGKTPSPAARRFVEYVNRRLGLETSKGAS